MLPGYGFTTFPDFQPHLHSFCCRGEHPSMWIAGPGESQDLSEPQEGQPFLHPCHHKHIAVCQQETLAFIELQPPVTPKLNGLGCSRPSSPDTRCTTPPLTLNSFRVNDMHMNDCHRTDNQHESTLSLNSRTSLDDGDLECNGGLRTSLQEETEKPHAVTTVCRPLHAALSLPLPLPLSSLYTNRDSWDSQLPCSSSSPEGPGFQSLDSYRPQRRASQGSLKEKSIRRKIQVYSPESLSDDSQCSPNLDADYIFPGPFASFLEEDLNGLSTLEDIPSPSFSDYVPELPNLSHNDIFDLPAEPLQIIEDSVPDEVEGSDIVDTSTTRGNLSSRTHQVDQERRRFSASELISRLQLSQRKNSFALKLGKSLSARVTSRDRHVSNFVVPNSDSPETTVAPSGPPDEVLEVREDELISAFHISKTPPDIVTAVLQRPPKKSFYSKHRSSGGSFDSAPHSPIGTTTTLLLGCDNGMHRRSAKLIMRKKSMEDDLSFLPTVSNSNRLSRFLPSSILYQEYSDVAINREIQRQQGKEPGHEEEGLREDGSDGTPSPSNLSPSSSFRSSRGSAFALWQDIPDVRSSGQLDNFSNEERKLQEAKFELVTSEASYIRSLTIAVDHFMLSQELAECLGTQDKQWLFSKLPEVKDVSERFLQDLEHRLEEDILRFDVCDIVLHHCPALRRVYLPYVTNQAYQEQTYQRLLQENPRFHGVLSRLEEAPICQRLPLTSFLILPFQRITRLKMLVENILKRTTPGSRDEDTATKAFNELKKIIKECNSSVQSMKRMEELIHLNKKIHFEGKIFPLISQSRWLVKHGELLEVDTQMMNISGSKLKFPTKPVYLHLFNDCLLLSRRKDTWKFMVFVHAKIGELKVKDLSQKLQGISGFIFHLQLCEGHQLKHQILLKSNTESGKQRWITAMFPSDPFEDIEQASENVDISQVQCIKSYKAQEHDELTLEKADILHAKTITSDGWVEGIRLSDGERGWFPKTYIEEITSRSARLRNLRENIRIKCVTQKLKGAH